LGADLSSEDNKLQYLIKEDGHHLTEKGHELYGKVISDYILKLIDNG
jgi:lysophospholipase L1-like esterase